MGFYSAKDRLASKCDGYGLLRLRLKGPWVQAFMALHPAFSVFHRIIWVTSSGLECRDSGLYGFEYGWGFRVPGSGSVGLARFYLTKQTM